MKQKGGTLLMKRTSNHATHTHTNTQQLNEHLAIGVHVISGAVR